MAKFEYDTKPASESYINGVKIRSEYGYFVKVNKNLSCTIGSLDKGIIHENVSVLENLSKDSLSDTDLRALTITVLQEKKVVRIRLRNDETYLFLDEKDEEEKTKRKKVRKK